jgi:hypothetical protein
VQLAALQGYKKVLKWAHKQWHIPLQDEIAFGMAGACKRIDVLGKCTHIHTCAQLDHCEWMVNGTCHCTTRL